MTQHLYILEVVQLLVVVSQLQRASGSFQEIRFWKVALSSSVVDVHTLSPRSIVSNQLTSSFGDIVGRWSF